MKTEQLLDEIREANLSYLILAQHLIRADRAEALFRLGLSDAVADILDQLTASQLARIAGTNLLLCRFRFDDSMVWRLLKDHSRDAPARKSVAGVHAAILMAADLPQAA